MAARRKRWSFSTGGRPHTVRVYERRPDGPLYARTWDSERQRWRKRSLGHRDKARAKAFAHELHARLVRGGEEQEGGRASVAEVFALYKRHRTPTKSMRSQRADERRIELWTRVLGAGRRPLEIRLAEWEAFIRARGEGAIDARGNHVPPDDRRPVRSRSVEMDCRFLSAAFRWASRWRLPNGTYLLPENPVRGFEMPVEKNPRRPVATQERYERTLEAAEGVMMEVTWAGKPESVRAPVRELLALANGTGRRLSAIRELRVSDVILESGPNGSLRFRADSDKMGYESIVPMSPEVRRTIDALLRERARLGDAPLFPSPTDRSVPVSRYLCDRWLREAEEEAGLEPLDGSLWHAYRRKFATELSDQPDRVVARLGGWKTPRTLDLYSQPDGAMMLDALEKRRQLREGRR